MSPKHFRNTQDWSRPELDALLAQAARFKRNKLGDELKGRSIALVFFNPSMRTRTSFGLGGFQLGGHAIVLQPGKDAWPIEFDLGTVMDGDTEEHIAEVARVLARYVDLIGVRAVSYTHLDVYKRQGPGCAPRRPARGPAAPSRRCPARR